MIDELLQKDGCENTKRNLWIQHTNEFLGKGSKVPAWRIILSCIDSQLKKGLNFYELNRP